MTGTCSFAFHKNESGTETDVEGNENGVGDREETRSVQGSRSGSVGCCRSALESGRANGSGSRSGNGIESRSDGVYGLGYVHGRGDLLSENEIATSVPLDNRKEIHVRTEIFFPPSLPPFLR